ILELDRGRGIPYEGNYSAWLEQKEKRLEQEGREEEAHKRTLAREREWIAASPRARQAKSKARDRAYEELVAKSADKVPQTAQIVIPIAERLGANVIDADALNKGYGDNLLIENLNFKLPPGGIVGVIGPNGAGKTTLFRMITGQEKPDGGEIRIGDTVRLGDVDTLRALEEAIEDYAGCAVIISHDRWFLDRIATHMLAFEGESHVEWFEGNFADYEEDKKRRLGIDSTIPHRIRYKKFGR